MDWSFFERSLGRRRLLAETAARPCHSSPRARLRTPPPATSFLRSLAALHDRKLPVELDGQSWTATSFISYFLQRLSSAVNMAAACEIRNQIVSGPRFTRPPRGGGRHRSLARA